MKDSHARYLAACAENTAKITQEKLQRLFAQLGLVEEWVPSHKGYPEMGMRLVVRPVCPECKR